MEETYDPTLRDALWADMAARDLTPKSLGAQVGVSSQAVTNWMGRGAVSRHAAPELLRLLGPDSHFARWVAEQQRAGHSRNKPLRELREEWAAPRASRSASPARPGFQTNPYRRDARLTAGRTWMLGLDVALREAGFGSCLERLIEIRPGVARRFDFVSSSQIAEFMVREVPENATSFQVGMLVTNYEHNLYRLSLAPGHLRRRLLVLADDLLDIRLLDRVRGDAEQLDIELQVFEHPDDLVQSLLDGEHTNQAYKTDLEDLEADSEEQEPPPRPRGG